MADDNVLNDPGLMDPSTEFGSMMQHAIKLKGAQMEAERRRFDSWPEFFQSTMWMRGEPLELRKLPLKQRLPAAVAIKEKGNAHFREKARRARDRAAEARDFDKRRGREHETSGGSEVCRRGWERIG
eukprot:2724444-Pleurochrysis_carterae.AAC.1